MHDPLPTCVFTLYSLLDRTTTAHHAKLLPPLLPAPLGAAAAGAPPVSNFFFFFFPLAFALSSIMPWSFFIIARSGISGSSPSSSSSSSSSSGAGEPSSVTRTLYPLALASPPSVEASSDADEREAATVSPSEP